MTDLDLRFEFAMKRTAHAHPIEVLQELSGLFVKDLRSCRHTDHVVFAAKPGLIAAGAVAALAGDLDECLELDGAPARGPGGERPPDPRL